MNAVNAYVENVMLGARDLLERRLVGQFKITNFEIQSYYARGQDAFVALMQAHIVDTIGRMADVAIGRDDVRDYNHMRGEFPRIARSDPHEIRGLQNIIGNTQGVLHDIHEPGRAGPDDPGASLFWEAAVAERSEHRAFRALNQAVRAELPTPVQIITTPAIKARYAAAHERLMRERNEAAFEWTRLRPWQWRKRHRLWRKLFGIGGWRVDVGPVDYGIPERVTPCGRFGRLREGGC